MSIESVVSNTPFLIRGHHLPFYQELLQEKEKSFSDSTMDVNSYQLAENLVEKIISNIKKPTLFYAPDKSDYLGNSTSEEVQFRDRMIFDFTKFLMLPDDYPIALVTTEDDICFNCVIGKHCKNTAKYSDTHAAKKFMKLTDGFVDAMIDLGIYHLSFGDLKQKLLQS